MSVKRRRIGCSNGPLPVLGTVRRTTAGHSLPMSLTGNPTAGFGVAPPAVSVEFLYNRVHLRGDSRGQQVTHQAHFVPVDHLTTVRAPQRLRANDAFERRRIGVVVKFRVPGHRLDGADHVLDVGDLVHGFEETITLQHCRAVDADQVPFKLTASTRSQKLGKRIPTVKPPARWTRRPTRP
jgi:hypothetical protein